MSDLLVATRLMRSFEAHQPNVSTWHLLESASFTGEAFELINAEVAENAAPLQISTCGLCVFRASALCNQETQGRKEHRANNS